MIGNKLQWKDSEVELPIIDDEHEEGETPYLALFYDQDEEDSYMENPTEEQEEYQVGIAYFYGKGWKNNRWEKIYVKYWLEIPELPKKRE